MVNIAAESEATDVVVCYTLSTYRLTLEISPAVKPVPTALTCSLFVAVSKDGVKLVIVATGALNSKVQVPTQVASEDAARMTATVLPLFISVTRKPVGLILQVS